MDAVLIARNSMPVLNTVCSTVQERTKGSRESDAWGNFGFVLTSRFSLEDTIRRACGLLVLGGDKLGNVRHSQL